MHHLLEAVGAADLFGVQDVVARNDVVERVEVPLRRVLEARPDGRLVLVAAAHLVPPRVVDLTARSIASSGPASIGGSTYSAYGSSGRSRSDVGGGLGAASQAELGEDVRHVVLGGAAADHEPPCDLLVRASVGQQCEYLGLALGQLAEVLGECAPARAKAAKQRSRGVRVGGRADPFERPERKARLRHGGFGCLLGQRPRKLVLRPRRLERQLQGGEAA